MKVPADSIVIEQKGTTSMELKLFDSELKILEILWREGELTAKQLAEITARETGWSKTTTYTVLKKCVDKGAVERKDPGFHCRALVSLEDVRASRTGELVDRLYGGRPDRLAAFLIQGKALSRAELDELKKLIEEME